MGTLNCLELLILLLGLVITICSAMPEDVPATMYRTRIVSETVAPTSVHTFKDKANLGFVHGFVSSFSVIIVSEIGDKTFFIAAIMAMKHARFIVFSGAMSALGFMTVLSVVFGWIATVVPRVYTYYISTALFALFGIKMLREGYKMSPNDGQEELEEVQMDLRKREDEMERESLTDVETAGGSRKVKSSFAINSRVFVQAFTMTFLAEWGDRSQLATIILAARENVYGVTIGGIIGHCICTGIAVLGGRFIAQKISARTVTIIGGVVFLIFAISALLMDPNSE